MNIIKICFTVLFLPLFLISQETLYLHPNTTQIFTELYDTYGLLNPPERTFFEDALYLDQFSHSSLLPLQPSNQAILDHASKVLSQYHDRIGDLELYIDPKKEKPFFYIAAGAKHLLTALVYAIVMSEQGKKFVFAEQAPFYMGHPNAVRDIFKYPNARFIAFHDPSEIKLKKGETLVEFVTSPNNPDGKFREPLTEAKIIIADFVFASSAFGEDSTGYLQKNLEWIREARKSGKTVFSFNSASKQFGKTSTRCGYIWFPMHDAYASSIFRNFFYFISSSTVGAPSNGLADFLNLIKAFLDSQDLAKSIREDASKSLKMRHEIIEKELLKKYPGSTVTSIPGSPTLFAKINDSRVPKKKASDVILEDLNTSVNNGEPMGETDAFIRLNLSGYSEQLVECANRLAGQEKYTLQDFLFTSSTKCSPITLYGNSGIYFVKPGDCMIDCDATKGPIEIQFPPFIDYLKSKRITVKKIDNSSNPIVIRTDRTNSTLKKQGESFNVQWSQPSYLNGHWSQINQ